MAAAALPQPDWTTRANLHHRPPRITIAHHAPLTARFPRTTVSTLLPWAPPRFLGPLEPLFPCSAPLTHLHAVDESHLSPMFIARNFFPDPSLETP